MRFILKVDKEDCFKVAELKEITAVELLIINKALHLLSQNEEVAERDRYVAEKLGAELMRMDAVQRPLTAIDGADIADSPQTDCEDIYPLVIIEDRYTGVYSNGEYTAWNMYFDEIPQDIDGDDVSCYDFWHSYNGIVGLGKTPNEAIEDLRKKLNAERNEDDK